MESVPDTKESNSYCLCGHRQRWHESRNAGGLVCIFRKPARFGSYCPCNQFQEDAMRTLAQDVKLYEQHES